MDDLSNEPHGPEQLPDEQPPDATSMSNQEALRTGASSRWLVPAGVLAIIAAVLYIITLRLQLVLPIIGIVYVGVMWGLMLVVALTTPPIRIRIRNRRLAILMLAMALGALLIAIGIYVAETMDAA